MPTFIIEVYAPAGASLPELVAAARVLGDGGDVRYLRTTFVPGDETCFHLFEGPSAEALVEAARLWGFEHLRIVEAVE